jgi:diaminopimelate epimerase
MAVTFHKMHGAGNDFVLLDLRQQAFDVNPAVARSLADRHTGIGYDQLLVIRDAHAPSQAASFEIWNADGSRAEQCGNGARCIGLYLAGQGDAGGGPFLVGSPAGALEMTCLEDGQVRVNMGVPDFEPANIPLTQHPVDGWVTLDLNDQAVQLGACSMGNPHAVCVVADVTRAPVTQLGPLISTHTAFPSGCNAGFAEIVSRGEINLRVYERGAEETRACGSGACAATVILSRLGLLDQHVKVNQSGGRLIIDWQGGSSPVMMSGPATYIFQGTLE